MHGPKGAQMGVAPEARAPRKKIVSLRILVLNAFRNQNNRVYNFCNDLQLIYFMALFKVKILEK